MRYLRDGRQVYAFSNKKFLDQMKRVAQGHRVDVRQGTALVKDLTGDQFRLGVENDEPGEVERILDKMQGKPERSYKTRTALWFAARRTTYNRWLGDKGPLPIVAKALNGRAGS